MPVLCYHHFGDQAKGRLVMATFAFREQMQYLKDNGYRVISLRDFLEFTRAAAATPAAKAPAPLKEEFSGVNPRLAEARDALDRGNWDEAVWDVERFLAENPGNADGLAVKKQALYQQGKAQLGSRRYADSYRALVQVARLQPDYEDTAKLLQQARTRAIDHHYAQGLRLYQEEKLANAISEWRIVLELDPQHANAKKNIDQAERLQKALDQREKK